MQTPFHCLFFCEKKKHRRPPASPLFSTPSPQLTDWVKASKQGPAISQECFPCECERTETPSILCQRRGKPRRIRLPRETAAQLDGVPQYVTPLVSLALPLPTPTLTLNSAPPPLHPSTPSHQVSRPRHRKSHLHIGALGGIPVVSEKETRVPHSMAVPCRLAGQK